MVTSRGTQVASGASGGCWSTKAHGLRQRGFAVAHAATEFEVLTSLLFTFPLRPVGSGNGRNTDVRRATVLTCSKHAAYVSPCQLQARQAERVRFEQEDTACAHGSVFRSWRWRHGARQSSVSPPRAIASATTASSCRRRGRTT